MPQNLNIFVRTNHSKEDFAREIEMLLEVHLTVLNEEYIFYSYTDPKNRWFQIGIHDLINDSDGLNFEFYDYQIEIGAFGIRDWEKHRDNVNEYARLIFDKLKSTGSYDLLLVQDVSFKLDEFHVT
ncbi:MAG: hypothetical protein ABI947_28865 [Chloroflexota bacterium]